jgi:hypothetical protein
MSVEHWGNGEKARAEAESLKRPVELQGISLAANCPLISLLWPTGAHRLKKVQRTEQLLKPCQVHHRAELIIRGKNQEMIPSLYTLTNPFLVTR